MARWDLSELYRSFEEESFTQDRETLKEIMDQLEDWRQPTPNESVEAVEEFLQLLKEFQQYYTCLMAFARLKLSVEAQNEKAEKIVEKLEKISTRLTGPKVKFQRWLQDQNIEQLKSESAIIAEHSFVLRELQEKSEFLLSKKEEVLVSELKRTGSSAWARLQQKLTSTLMVPITVDGEEKELPLSVVRNFAYKEDPELRQKGYEAELNAYEKIDDSVAAALNGIKGEVLTMVEKRGYESPLQKTLLDSRMEEATLDTMLEAMQEFLPAFHEYYRVKGELLGHEDGLPFYDLFAPVGEADMEFSFAEAKEFILENVGRFSSRMADLFQKAFQENWIDAEPREGKRGGAFCYNIQPIGESRVLSNFSGSFSDMTTLAHELGHAYHGYCLKDESILNTDYPMPLAETASIFSETVVINAAREEADEEQTLAILQNRLDKAGQVIVDIYSRFLFESWLFENREQASLSVDELKDFIQQAQIEAYGSGLNHDYLHPYLWLNKPHYYSAGNNYYNFPYAFGLLFGLGVYSQYLQQKDQGFMDRYDELLRSTGSKKVADVAAMVDIDVNERSFWENSLEIIKEDIDRFVELAEKRK